MLEIDHFATHDKPLRIAVVTETWPPDLNGVSITMHRLCLELQSRGHSVQVIRPRHKQSQTDLQAPAEFEQTLTRGIPIPNYPEFRLGLPSKRLLIKLWTHQRPDIVHLATEGPLGWSGIQAARKLKLPTSSDFRTNFHNYSHHYGVGRLKKAITLYLRKFHNLTNCTTVPTDRVQTELAQLGFRHLRVIGRGVDTKRFHPGMRNHSLRNEWGARLQTRVYLYVGRLTPEKNPLLLARTWDAIRTGDPEAQLVIVGDGPAADIYRRLLPNARFAGSQTGTTLAAYYASSDFFLFPSITETYGNVVAEAMSSGLVTLAFGYAAPAELMTHAHNGYIARYNDEDHYLQLAAQIALLGDQELGKIRERARATLINRGWDVVTMQMESLWRELLVTHRYSLPGLNVFAGLTDP